MISWIAPLFKRKTLREKTFFHYNNKLREIFFLHFLFLLYWVFFNIHWRFNLSLLRRLSFWGKAINFPFIFFFSCLAEFLPKNGMHMMQLSCWSWSIVTKLLANRTVQNIDLSHHPRLPRLSQQWAAFPAITNNKQALNKQKFFFLLHFSHHHN